MCNGVLVPGGMERCVDFNGYEKMCWAWGGHTMCALSPCVLGLKRHGEVLSLSHTHSLSLSLFLSPSVSWARGRRGGQAKARRKTQMISPATDSHSALS